MTADINPNASPQMPDVFDMERLTIPQSTFQRADSLRNKQPSAGTILTKITSITRAAKPIHFAQAGVLVAIVWIGWPYLFSEDAHPAHSESRLMLPATAESTVAQAAATRTAVPAAPQLSAAAQEQEAPPAAPKSMPPFAQPLPTVQTTSTVAAPASPHRTRNTAQRFRQIDIAIGPASSKFSLNTVYAGQAWIQDDERTYVVSAGDKIKGISIVSIDARERLVVTSQGIIR